MKSFKYITMVCIHNKYSVSFGGLILCLEGLGHAQTPLALPN